MTAAHDALAHHLPHGAPTPVTPVPPWLAVRTRSRHEVAVRNQLVARGLETFLPMVARWSRWKDRRRRVDWPLFPGYCFVRIDPAEVLRVLSCSGVVSIVSFDGRPAAVEDAEIQSVRRTVESELRFDPCPLITKATGWRSSTDRCAAWSGGSYARGRARG